MAFCIFCSGVSVEGAATGAGWGGGACAKTGRAVKSKVQARRETRAEVNGLSMPPIIGAVYLPSIALRMTDFGADSPVQISN